MIFPQVVFKLLKFLVKMRKKHVVLIWTKSKNIWFSNFAAFKKILKFGRNKTQKLKKVEQRYYSTIKKYEEIGNLYK